MFELQSTFLHTDFFPAYAGDVRMNIEKVLDIWNYNYDEYLTSYYLAEVRLRIITSWLGLS